MSAFLTGFAAWGGGWCRGVERVNGDSTGTGLARPLCHNAPRRRRRRLVPRLGGQLLQLSLGQPDSLNARVLGSGHRDGSLDLRVDAGIQGRLGRLDEGERSVVTRAAKVVVVYGPEHDAAQALLHGEECFVLHCSHVIVAHPEVAVVRVWTNSA